MEKFILDKSFHPVIVKITNICAKAQPSVHVENADITINNYREICFEVRKYIVDYYHNLISRGCKRETCACSGVLEDGPLFASYRDELLHYHNPYIKLPGFADAMDKSSADLLLSTTSDEIESSYAVCHIEGYSRDIIYHFAHESRKLIFNSMQFVKSISTSYDCMDLQKLEHAHNEQMRTVVAIFMWVMNRLMRGLIAEQFKLATPDPIVNVIQKYKSIGTTNSKIIHHLFRNMNDFIVNAD